MAHGPEHQIEHAEHAQHAAHDPFDRRVTMSIAMAAAILACVTMMGHRAHNDTLRLEVEAANKWAYYQAQKFRSHMYQVNLELLTEIARLDGKKTTPSKTQERWREQVKKYNDRLPKEQKIAETLQEEGHRAHLRADRFDYGELGVQLAVILCSIAVLTKRNGFWYVGLLSCIAGTLVALSGLLELFMGTGH